MSEIWKWLMGIICKDSRFDKINITLILLLSILGGILFLGFIFVNRAEDWWGNGIMKDNGAIGDYFNGMLGPFIAMTGVITTFAAFYVQYKANQEQREALKNQQDELEKQQEFLSSQLEISRNANDLQKSANDQQAKAIESQNAELLLQKQQLKAQIDQQRIDQFEKRFFEMLKIHRENASKMQFIRKRYGQAGGIGTVGWGNYRAYSHHEVIEAINIEFEAVFRFIQLLMDENFVSKQDAFVTASWAYGLLFTGGLGMPPSWKLLHETDELKARNLKDIEAAIQVFVNREYGYGVLSTDIERRILGVFDQVSGAAQSLQMLQGYIRQLSSYFRLLFQMVDQLETFEADGFTDDDRKRYAKLLRAQFTDEDQLLFYYNSLWSVGDVWWERGFISKYKLIKQVPIARIPIEISPVKRLSKHLKSSDINLLQEHFDTDIDAQMLF